MNGNPIVSKIPKRVRSDQVATPNYYNGQIVPEKMHCVVRLLLVLQSVSGCVYWQRIRLAITYLSN